MTPTVIHSCKPATALVTGANGGLGRLLIHELAAEGVRTRAYVRSAASSAGFHEGVQTVEGDIRDAGAVRRAVEGVDAIFHLAALVHAAPPDERPLSEYVQVNVDGTENIVAAAERARVRVVYISTINVYGPGQGRVIDERTACRPEGAYAVTKREAETLVERLGERATILRLASVFGRSMKGNYPRLVRAMRRGTFVRIGPGLARKTVVYETDVVRAAILAAESVSAGGQIYNVTDGATHTIDEILDAIAAAAGARPPRLRIPAALARSAARGVDLAGRLIGRSVGAKASVDKYLEDIAVRGDKIQDQLGFRPAVDLRTGWRLAAK
jgi:UDP-glucose 4-epimerase